MLLRAEFRNYRCLRDADLQLSPLTVLVGPNASGKSSALQALQLLTDSIDLQPADAWQHERQSRPEVRFVADDNAEVTISLNDGALHQFLPGRSFRMQLLQLDLHALRNTNMVQEGRTLEGNGQNLTNVFATLDRARQQAAVHAFCKLVPVFSDINAKPVTRGHHQLEFRDAFREDVRYTPSQVSDGTMLVLAYLLTQYQVPQVDLLAIEEPERGLHPYLLGNLMRFLRSMAHGELGPKPVQVVLATHSASLLDHAQPEEVRFFKRTADGSVAIESAPYDDKAPWSEYYSTYQESLGQAWLSGGLGGVPGS